MSFYFEVSKVFQFTFQTLSEHVAFYNGPRSLSPVYLEILAYREHFLCYGNLIHNFSISFPYVWNTPYLQEYQMDRENMTLCGNSNLLYV